MYEYLCLDVCECVFFFGFVNESEKSEEAVIFLLVISRRAVLQYERPS